jgi:hypothetical protein
MLWIVGAILVLAAVGLFIAASAQKRKLDLMAGTQTSNAADVRSLADSVAKDIGAGSFAEATEVKGTVQCEHPLTAELTDTPCVYYEMRVTREYEETYWDTDSKGNRVQRHRRGSEAVSQNSRSCVFDVEDATGRIAVDPTGASISADKVYDRFEPGEPRSTSLAVGRWRFDLASVALAGGRRTLGYKYVEKVIPLGKPIYVLGEASDAGGQLSIRKPTKKGVGFIVSMKSEEELSRGAATANRWLTAGAAVTGLGGLVVVVLDVLGVI